MKSYFAYIRVSTVRQGERGSSLAEQRDAIESYAHRNDLTIGGWFEEMETAAKQGRRTFNKMLAELERRRAAGVIIHKIDRSSRNLRDWARLGELMDRGVEVRFVTDNLDLSTRGGRLSADIQAVVAADYVRNLREEVKKGRYGRLKQGFYPLAAPMGYLNCGSAKPKSIDPGRGPLVRQAFELYGTGLYSLQSLRHEMAGRGLTTGAGRPIPAGHLARILHQPFYMGVMRLPKTGETFEGKHEPLVSPALFARVQAVASGRLYPRTQIHRYLFRRLIKCTACSRSLTGERQKGLVYYRCHALSCRGTSVTEKAIDERLREAFGLLRLDDGDVGDFRDVLAELQASEGDQTEARADGIRRDLAMVDRRFERLTDALLDDVIDKSAYEERRAALIERRLALRNQLEHGDDSTSAQIVAERFELAFAAQQGYEIGIGDERREIVKTICSNLWVSGKTVEIPMLSPFRELRDWAIENECGPVRKAVRTSRLKSIRLLIQRLVGKSSSAA